ncbi:transposase [Acidithiobacillus ferriphilus]|uniref:transposase n=1 Tax=Acidithiobacillus ferriphilus TaxID=1689834 RepID=UPI001C073334|nr:transposase [Acidithiobacillus ferriphilus]
MKYAKERKEAVLRKMLPPSNRSIQEIAAEESISEATLYLWRKAARGERGGCCQTGRRPRKGGDLRTSTRSYRSG